MDKEQLNNEMWSFNKPMLFRIERTLIVSLFLMVISGVAHGQVQSEKAQESSSSNAASPLNGTGTVEPQTFDDTLLVLDEIAQFPGGLDSLNKYIAENLQYPQWTIDSGPTGKCYLKFIVSKSGEISDIRILKGIPGCKNCDEDAVELVRNMPGWIPGKLKDRPVNSYYHLRIIFGNNQ